MRIWSLHPSNMDVKGIVALWRETLLAQKVLHGKTAGYKNHPQLIRFKAQDKPLSFICNYLHFVCDEACLRGYKFNRSKIILPRDNSLSPISVTSGQVSFEWAHLSRKLNDRAPEQIALNNNSGEIKLHPMFKKVNGKIEAWEKNTNK